MTQRLTTVVRIMTDQEGDGTWNWTCVVDEDLIGRGFGYGTREAAHRGALKRLERFWNNDDG